MFTTPERHDLALQYLLCIAKPHSSEGFLKCVTKPLSTPVVVNTRIQIAAQMFDFVYNVMVVMYIASQICLWELCWMGVSPSVDFLVYFCDDSQSAKSQRWIIIFLPFRHFVRPDRYSSMVVNIASFPAFCVLFVRQIFVPEKLRYIY